MKQKFHHEGKRHAEEVKQMMLTLMQMLCVYVSMTVTVWGRKQSDDVEDKQESKKKDGQLIRAIVDVTEQEGQLIGASVDAIEQNAVLRHKINGLGAATMGN